MDEGALANTAMELILRRLDAGYAFIRDDVFWLFGSLVVIQLLLMGISWSLGVGNNVIAGFLRRIMFMSFIYFVIDRFPFLVDTLAEGFIEFGLKAGGSHITRSQVLDPGALATVGWETSLRIWSEISALTGQFGTGVVPNLPEIVALMFAGAVVLVAFFLVAIQVFIAFVSFKLGAIVVFVLVPWSVLRPTAFIAERPIGWMIGKGVQLMLISLVLSLSIDLINFYSQIADGRGQTAMSLREATSLAFGSVVILVMTLLASRLAREITSGSPSLGLGDVAAIGIGTAGATYGAVRVGATIARGTTNVGQSILSRTRGAFGGLPGRATNQASQLVRSGQPPTFSTPKTSKKDKGS